MKKCPHCAEDIQAEAKVCRFCNRELVQVKARTPQTPRRWLWMLLSVMAVLSVAAYVTSDGAPVAQAPPERLPIKVTAADLSAAYTANEVAADRNYKGEPLLVTGQIDRISKDITDKPYIVLYVGPYRRDVQATFSADDRRLDALTKGSQVTLRCVGAGLWMNVQLKDCRVQ